MEKVDLHSLHHAYCRFFSRAVREDGRWKLLSFEVLLERDELRPVYAGEPLPVDAARLAGLRDRRSCPWPTPASVKAPLILAELKSAL
ncbi:hypothetical protein ABZW11_03615 [Nonomuraea sp. NPDC004580]|uniref:hypothetical protein n=1 Tax=Nonomuraea sp. NPDC004580 TaxID=3154552 RepID=UPI0033B22043